MKYCTYTYKGRKIGDVKALNDFLLEKKPYENSLGEVKEEVAFKSIDELIERKDRKRVYTGI